jgi:ribA/ribD-fused uncharacterized protein
MAITSFQGEYRFLSNFWPCNFTYAGFEWNSSEHAYQAMKKQDIEYWNQIRSKTAGGAKKLGSKVEKDASFNSNRINYMRSILVAKFYQNPDLLEKLQATAPHDLIEGNSWGDVFWGQCPIGTGSNHLGKLLMELRDTNFK